jgi:hypothetical protein
MANASARRSKFSNVDTEVDAEQHEKDAERQTEELDEQQDLNQGMSTGTHSSSHRGVNWGPSYRVGGGEAQSDPKAKPAKQKSPASSKDGKPRK